jgi:hypothetical protein
MHRICIPKTAQRHSDFNQKSNENASYSATPQQSASSLRLIAGSVSVLVFAPIH